MKITLASASPRRRELLKKLGIDFTSIDVDVDEGFIKNVDPLIELKRVALLKAKTALKEFSEMQPCHIIAADTIVMLNNDVMTKPIDEKNAGDMLRKLSDNTHQVATAMTIYDASNECFINHIEITKVSFGSLSKTDIDDYIMTGEPMDKAGAYGIQGLGGKFIKSIDGCYYNVVGLPLYALWKILKKVKAL